MASWSSRFFFWYSLFSWATTFSSSSLRFFHSSYFFSLFTCRSRLPETTSRHESKFLVYFFFGACPRSSDPNPPYHFAGANRTFPPRTRSFTYTVEGVSEAMVSESRITRPSCSR